MNEREKLLDQAQTITDRAQVEGRSLTPGEHSDVQRLMSAVADFDAKVGKPISWSGGSVILNDREKGRYNLLSAIRNAADGRFAGTFEAEVSDEVAHREGRVARGFFLPQDIVQTRTTGGATLLEGTAGYGGNLVATNLLAGDFISLLRNRMVCARAGARFMTGLVGHVAIPRATAAVSAFWVAEDTDITVGRPEFGQLTLAPVTLGAAVDISRKLLLQSSIDVSQFVINDIATSIAIELDRAAIHGTGVGEPTGILNTVGINACPASATTNANTNPSWSTLLAFESAIQTDNADSSTMTWAMNASIMAFCKKTAKSSTAADQGFLISSDTPSPRLAGYNVIMSNQISSSCAATQTGYKASGGSAIILADWSQLIIAIWGGSPDILVNPYSASLSGTVRVVGHMDVCFGLRQPTAFAAGCDYDTD